MPRVRTASGGKTFLHEVHLMGRVQAAIGRITGKGGFYSTFARRGLSIECKAYQMHSMENRMDQHTFDPTHRAQRAAAHRLCAAALRVAARLLLSSSLGVPGAGAAALCAPAAAMLIANAANAGEADGPIVIAGPNEKDPAALTELAEHMQAAPAKRAGSAATLAAGVASLDLCWVACGRLQKGPGTPSSTPKVGLCG